MMIGFLEKNCPHAGPIDSQHNPQGCTTAVFWRRVIRRWSGRLAVAAGFAIVHPVAATAQSDVLAPAPLAKQVHWWYGAVVLGGLSALMLLDEPAQQFAQDNRSGRSNSVAETFRHFGQPEVYGPLTLGLLGTGIITGNGEITRSGARLATTLAVVGTAAGLGKLALGRPRPSESLDADGYIPFSGQEAMPSGHTAVAFAVATALGDDIDRTWARVGLYTLASGVAWSRMNDNRHWMSDVAAGAVLGVVSAKAVNGRWRLFNLRPPRILLGPSHAGVAWQVTF
jgi:membrane-associated phospholipid phosphatase